MSVLKYRSLLEKINLVFSFLQITVREINIMYNERKVFIMLPEILGYITVVAFLGVLAYLPCYVVYAAVKVFKLTKETKNTNEV